MKISLRQKKLISALLLVMVVVGVGVFLSNINNVSSQGVSPRSMSPNTAGGIVDTKPSGGSLGSGNGGDALAGFFGWILYWIATFFAKFVGIFIEAMVEIATYNGFLSENIVNNGWSIVRDVCNNFFIIMMLVIAVGTILRRSDYHYKQLLPKLLIAAIVINFSKMITGIFIDFSQVVMLFFASAMETKSGLGLILGSLGLWELFNVATEKGTTSTFSDKSFQRWDVVIALLFAVVLSVVACVVMGIITVVLVYRIVMLWFIVIFSPIGFIGAAFPPVNKYSSMWWEELGRYLVVGPITIFLLYLSFFAMGNETSIGREPPTNLTSQSYASEVALQGDITKKMQPANFIQFMIIIGLMVGSLIVGQKTGAMGSKLMGSGVAKLQGVAKGATIGMAKGATGRLATSKPVGSLVRKIGNAPIVGGVTGMRAASRVIDSQIAKRDSEKEKVSQARVANASKAMGIDGMSQTERMKLAQNSRNKDIQIAATQSLARDGMLKDDPSLSSDERKKRIDVINKARTNLKSNPELLTSFDDNIRKYAPAMATRTVYADSSGNVDLEKLNTAVTTGKIELKSLMGSIDDDTLGQLDAALKKEYGGIGQYLIDNAKDDKEIQDINKAMSSKTKKRVWDGKNEKDEDIDGATKITHESFVKEKNANGEIISYDEDKRKKYLKATNNISKAYDLNSDSEQEEARKYVKKNTKAVVDNIDSGAINQQFMQIFSDLLSPKNLDDLEARGDEFESNVKTALKDATSALDPKDIENNTSMSDDERIEARNKAQQLMKTTMIRTGTIDSDLTSSQIGKEYLERIVSNMSAKDLGALNSDPVKGLKSPQVKDIALKVDINALKGMAATGSNPELLRMILHEIRSFAEANPENEEAAQKVNKLKDI